MKLVVNSIALSLSLYELTQTDGQRCGIFRHVDRNEVDEDYANQQIINIIKKYKNSFLPAKGAFKTQKNNLIGTSNMATEGEKTQLRKQKRMRFTSNRRKLLKGTETEI